jgi:acyl-CoA oxidase
MHCVVLFSLLCLLQLFGGTVLKLGTARHHGTELLGGNSGNGRSFLDQIDTVDQIGCFGLTELGYGNNAVEMETTATFDAATQEFVIHSPSTLSQKFWITNSADHAKWCVVFAQTIVSGQNQGIHGFLVPIRDAQHNVCKGVRLEESDSKREHSGCQSCWRHRKTRLIANRLYFLVSTGWSLAWATSSV